MVDSVKDIKIGKVDENINYSKFRAPTIDIYDDELNKKIADKFIKLGSKTRKGVEDNVNESR